MAWLHSVVFPLVVFVNSLIGFGHSPPTAQAPVELVPRPSSLAASSSAQSPERIAGASPIPAGYKSNLATHRTNYSPVPKPPTGLLSNAGTSTGVVIGYIWVSDVGSPKFASVMLPAWGLGTTDFNTHEYQVFIFTNNVPVFYEKAKAVVDKVVFPAGGISKFEVVGIDPQLGICASDRNVTWGITFAQSGIFKGTKTPITRDMPDARCAAAI